MDKHDVAPSRANGSPSVYASSSKVKAYVTDSFAGSSKTSSTNLLYTDAQSGRYELPRPPSPHPSVLRASSSSLTSPGSPLPRTSPNTIRIRVPSRTQLRHASAARRLSIGVLGKNALLDDYQLGTPTSSEAKDDELPLPSKVSTDQKQKKREATPEALAKPPPYLRDTMNAIGVDMIADSASMETLMGNRHFLKATFLTPESVLEKIDNSDNYYHVWVAAMLAMEEMSIKRNGFEKVLELAFTKFLVEFGSAIVGCLDPDIPHYTFVDPRGIMQTGGMETMFEQAVAVVEGLEKKGIKRDMIYISIPATESGLSIARNLKEQHSIKTNLVFVSGLTQAVACTAAGAAAITMPVKSILAYHELKRGTDSSALNPHPGRQNIKATACYIKHHNLDTQLIASGFRSLNEIEHCSALSSVCLADFQVEAARWHRMRVCRPPGPKSTAMMRAMQIPFPPICKQDELGFRYFMGMSDETRKETAVVLGSGLRVWQDCAARIADVIRSEMQRRIDICAAPLQKTVVLEEAIKYREQVRIEKCRSLSSRGQPRQDTLDIPFPSYDAEQEEQVVPQSPYWQDLDAFDENDSNSDEDDIVVF